MTAPINDGRIPQPTEDWPFIVAGYGKDGRLLLVTRHKNAHSKDVEVTAWRSRIRSGEVREAKVWSLTTSEETIWR